MLFNYKAVDSQGANKEGEIDAPTRDMAISGLQRRGLVVISIKDEKESKSIFQRSFFEKVKTKDVVILSRQIATLFEAQVSALKAFTMLASSTENKLLSKKLVQIGDDLQAGVSISGALAKHPDVFSDFYVNMVKVGEETGKMGEMLLGVAVYYEDDVEQATKDMSAVIEPLIMIVIGAAVGFFAVAVISPIYSLVNVIS